MKQFLLILTLIFLSTGCSNDDKKLDTSNIVGTWKHYEEYDNFKWNKVDGGYTYTFNANGTFKSTRFTECIKGKYTVASDKLTLDYDCDEFTTQVESPPATYVENYKLEKGYMYLTPTYLVCFEGCTSKFRKISD